MCPPPVKFKPTERTYDRFTKEYKIKHYYMKAMSKQKLIDYVNSYNPIPKRRQKCIKELTRRGIKI